MNNFLANFPNRQNLNQEMSSLQILQTKLSHNTLTEFELGVEEAHFRSKRDVQAFLKIIREQHLPITSLDKHSCLQSIRIGYRLPRFALWPILQEALPMLFQNATRVHHLQLFLDCWVPEHTMKGLVSLHTLKILDLRATRIRSLHRIDPRHCPDSSSNEILLIEDNILTIVPLISLTVETLKLIDCNFLPKHLKELCAMLRKRKRLPDCRLKHLSLRHNRYLEGNWEELFSLSFLETMDLSICDLSETDGFSIAKVLKNNRTCKQLSLAGNYRMAHSIPKVVQVASTTLVELDISFCGVQNEDLQQVFDILATSPNCTIRSLRMQGSRIRDKDPLVRCLRQNKSLMSMILNNPRERFPVESHDLEEILDSVKCNYYLQTFKVDVMASDRARLEGIEFWLNLNRCGRCILLQSNSDDKYIFKSWSMVLQRAATLKDTNIMFWLLKHGAWNF